MTTSRLFAIMAAGLLAAACGGGPRCDPLSRAEALRMAADEKSGMLRRSADDYAANFASSAPAFVRIGAETNGYAANVGFEGRDGRILIALIHADCIIGWTQRDPVPSR